MWIYMALRQAGYETVYILITNNSKTIVLKRICGKYLKWNVKKNRKSKNNGITNRFSPLVGKKFTKMLHMVVPQCWAWVDGPFSTVYNLLLWPLKANTMFKMFPNGLRLCVQKN